MQECSRFYCYVRYTSSHILKTGNSIGESSSPASRQGQKPSSAKTVHVSLFQGTSETCSSEFRKAHHMGLSSSTNVFRHWPDSASQMRLQIISQQLAVHIEFAYINPSIAHETTRVPSWLKLTAVTGSECAARTFKGLPRKRCSQHDHIYDQERTSCDIPDSHSFIKAP